MAGSREALDRAQKEGFHFPKRTERTGRPGAIRIDFDSLPPIPPSILGAIDPEDLKDIDPKELKRAYYEEYLAGQVTPSIPGTQTPGETIFGIRAGGEKRVSHEQQMSQLRDMLRQLGGNPDEVRLEPASQSQETTGVRIPIGARRQALAAMASAFLPLTTLFARLFRHQPTPRK